MQQGAGAARGEAGEDKKGERSTERELGEIRREVMEGRNLIIKADNQLKSIHGELKMLGRRQEDFYRRSIVASWAAYSIFGLLAILGALGIIRLQAAMGKGELATLQKQVEGLKVEAARAVEKRSSDEAQVQKADRIFGSLGAADPVERVRAVAGVKDLDLAALTPLERKAIEARAAETQKAVVSELFEKAKTAFRRAAMDEVTKTLEPLSGLGLEGPDAVSAAFILGTADFQLKRFDKAVAPLEQFMRHGKGQKNHDYAILMLGQSLEQTHEQAKAMAVYRRGVAEHPESDYAGVMKRRLAAIEKAAAPAPAPNNAIPAPAAPAPAR